MAKLTDAQRNALRSNQFVFAKTRQYPVHDKEHAQAALMIGGRNFAKNKLSVAKYNQIVKKVNIMWGFKAKLKK